LAAGALAPACASTATDTAPDLRGEEIEVVAVWQDAEADAFERVLARFDERTGARTTYTSTAGEAIATVLGGRLEAGDPPDVALLPQPGLIHELAAAGALEPISAVVGEQVAADWAPVWARLGSVEDELFGLWFKASAKSLIWYSIGAFEAAGVVPPDDLDGLMATAADLTAAGSTPWSLTGADGDAWTLTDWFENLYLNLAGPERYDALAARRIPWTDPSVGEALRAMAALLRPEHVVRAAGAETTFTESVAAVFATEPVAAMVMEGDFVPGVVAGTTPATIGIDVDVFPFPGPVATDRLVVVGGDAAVLMRPSEAGAELLRFLASAEAATVWAGIGGFVSPNEAVELTAYPDATTRRIARSLLESGAGLRFDLSDLQPAAFGGTPGAGMWRELSRFLAAPGEVAATMARLEAAAELAWSAD
jgi:alpha-glucoside transport system substrate-binding protein